MFTKTNISVQYMMYCYSYSNVSKGIFILLQVIIPRFVWYSPVSGGFVPYTRSFGSSGGM